MQRDSLIQNHRQVLSLTQSTCLSLSSPSCFTGGRTQALDEGIGGGSCTKVGTELMKSKSKAGPLVLLFHTHTYRHTGTQAAGVQLHTGTGKRRTLCSSLSLSLSPSLALAPSVSSAFDCFSLSPFSRHQDQSRVLVSGWGMNKRRRASL